jgi:hypothetical protein
MGFVGRGWESSRLCWVFVQAKMCAVELCVVVVVHVEAALSEGGSGGQNRSGVRRGRW